MRLLVIALGLLVVPAANAQGAAVWRIDGAISGRTFQLDCRFQGAGGTCVDVASGGARSHPLTSLSTTGDQVAWGFKTKVAIMSIAMGFTGRVSGNRMSGTVRAAGRTGSFTGIRR